jgi:hypothetical protein
LNAKIEIFRRLMPHLLISLQPAIFDTNST